MEARFPSTDGSRIYQLCVDHDTVATPFTNELLGAGAMLYGTTCSPDFGFANHTEYVSHHVVTRS